MRRRGFTFWQLLAILLFLSGIAAVLFPVVFRAREICCRPTCQSNLKQMGLAFKMYNQDYDERMPLVQGKTSAECSVPCANPFGWADALFPYLKATQIFQCPDDRLPINDRRDSVLGRFTDYYYNSNLNGVTTKLMIEPATLILAADGNDGTDGTDARYSRNMLPKAWRDDSKSPARRHKDGANYAFVDGHVKWLQPELVKDIRSNKNDYSFAVK